MFTYIFDLSALQQILFAGFSAFIISLFITAPIIRFLKKKKFKDGDSIKASDKLQELHKNADKSETPTMGGIAIFISIVISSLLWIQLSAELAIGLLGALGFFLIGFYDDWKKLTKKDKDGLSFRKKLGLQVLLSTIVGAALILFSEFQTNICFLDVFSIELGWFYLFVAVFILVGTSNAANLTDGLDGLAAGVVAIVTAGLCALAFNTFTDASVFAAVVAGVLVGFLWFNSFPAKVFMGDTGSLTIGFLVGFLAIIIKSELLLIPLAGILVAEASSVIIQVLYYKKTKKRVFLCAPLHHHYQFKGWAENQIVVRFWLISLVLSTVTVILVAGH